MITQADVDQALDDIITLYNGQTVAFHDNYPAESLVPVAYYAEQLTGLDPLPTNFYEWGNGLPGRLRQYFTAEPFNAAKEYPRGTILISNLPNMAIVDLWLGDGRAQVFEQSEYCRISEVLTVGCAYAVVPLLTQEVRRDQTVYIENTVDDIAYKRLQTAPKAMYVNKQGGIDKIDFSGNVANFRDFTGIPNTHKPYGAEVRIMGTAHHPVIPTGQDFWMDMDDWGNFTGTGLVANKHGYLLGDLSDTKPLLLNTVKQKPVLITEVTRPTVNDNTVLPDDITYYHFRYLNEAHEPVRYKVMVPVTVFDYAKHGQMQRLTRGKTVKIIGTFQWQGRVFLLPVMDDPNIPLFKYMYGIPETMDRVRVIEELPDFSTIIQEAATSPAERVAIKRAHPTDYVIHYATKVELLIEKLFKRGNK